MNKFEHIKRYIEEAKTICLVAHIGPDGDAIGSVGAMYHFLKGIGKEVYMVLPNVPDTFNFLPNIQDKVDSVKLENYDLLICLDTSSTDRLDILPLDLAKAKNTIVIDHHKNNEMQATVKYVDEDSPANCEIIYDLIKYMGQSISKNVAEYIYMGIMTDTGSFNYQRTSSKTHKIAGEMIDAGADFVKICKILNDTYSEAKMKLVAHIITNMESCINGKIRIGIVDKSIIDRVGAKDTDAEHLVNYLRSIENTIVAVYFRQLDDGSYKVSIRSEEPIDASELASQFGGGGHKRAAGFSTNDIEKTKMELIEMLERLLKSENNGNT